MNIAVDQRALARLPQQQRAIDRFELVLQEAQALLAEEGLGGFSIPAVAARLGYTRASIYKFFPTPYAVLNELVRRHFAGLEQKLVADAVRLVQLPWREVVRTIVQQAASYHNEHPGGMMLALGGAVTDESYRSYELTVRHLGSLARQLLQVRGMTVPTEPVDAATLAVDVATTCFRQSYLAHGHITPAYEEAAAEVMVDFLQRRIVAPGEKA
ncbi:TetR/AcrR family transcriptional regulator [Solimonas sp. K1W22B-7]|uniref:TetR/AcrR family transcriptional regulator n=1 Tax=Solimonas sp. K1W22B-7 TaxID=2303331 RepID=UPI0013C483E5|nr:TetR/AcrR family transcriptional regulator [Solimonas sp. K1W22B-7]